MKNYETRSYSNSLKTRKRVDERKIKRKGESPFPWNWMIGIIIVISVLYAIAIGM
ncbi:hypothetical protein [uncultured Sphaerochaeta sp.]|uniref:hypothetical protein n=1 Tax=uncultured Sphaerochaeta sp. TaxID=886478 RepID=UPI00260A2885|nr:hypothetical protein [uncultured Sphaerochaeta sp.]